MRLSHERRPVRWGILVATWALAAVLLCFHALAIRDYLALADRAGLRGAPRASTPLQQPYLSFASDAQTWVQHAIALTEGDDLRLRYTTIDNAPKGREVHWNSAWAWMIVGAGEIRWWFTGEPLPNAIERAAIWLNPAVLLALIVLFSTWLARRAGAAAGVFITLGMLGHNQFYEGFIPGYTDHHGLLSAAVLGLMLGTLAMGGGWWRAPQEGQTSLLPATRSDARGGAIFSAISAGLGMWISAASLIPPIAIAGLTALLMVLWRGRRLQASGAVFDPSLWRLWSRLGACVSAFFYLLEYAPAHLGLRLEANHPLYALAWLGGGELVAQIAERWLAAPGVRWARPQRLIGPLLCVLAVPFTIAVGGTAVFILRDPFQTKLPHYVLEGMNLLERFRMSGWKEMGLFLQLSNLPLVISILWLILRRQREHALLWFCLVATLLLTAMGWWQTRWLLNASGPQLCLALVLLADCTAGRRAWLQMTVIAGAMGLLYVPSALNQVLSTRKMVSTHSLSSSEALQPLFRDIAATLRASQPTGKITLLSPPNGSTGIGYYGRFATVGTLYWENLAGLKVAGTILSTASDDEAAALIREHGITHLAILSEENFLAQYFDLLHPDLPAEDLKKTFGYRLFINRQIPLWLEILPYQVPPDLQPLKVTVLLFKVAFGQKMPEALYHLAQAKVAMGDIAGAEKDFDTVAQLAPNAPEPWLRKGELFVIRKDWPAALDALTKGITRAPREEWPKLYNAAAISFYSNGAAAHAARLYQESLALVFDPVVAGNLAWLRATAGDASVRNGTEALNLAQQALKTNPTSPYFLACMAAALAELGRYPEAIDVGTKALDAARSAGDALSINKGERCLNAYRAGQPWHE